MKKIAVFTLFLMVGVSLIHPVYAEKVLQPLAVQLYWEKTVEFAGILLAQEYGWYEEAGLDVTIRAWKPEISVIDEVLEGRVQIGVMDGSELIRARADGAALKAIAAMWQKSPFSLFSKKSQDIETPQQLVGKKVGITVPDSVIMLKVILQNQGLNYRDITPVQVATDTVPLLEDEVDVLAGFLTDEMLWVKEQGYDVNYIPGFKYGYEFYGEAYVVTDSLLQEQPDVLERFLEITLRGWQKAFSNPQKAAELIVQRYQPERSLSHQVESLKMFKMLATLGEGKKYLGWMESAIWQRSIDVLQQFAHIKQPPAVDEVFTMSVLERVYFDQ